MLSFDNLLPACPQQVKGLTPRSKGNPRIAGGMPYVFRPSTT